MMAEPVKFTFDQAFDGGAKNRYDLELERRNSEAQRAQKEALERGQQEGRQIALSEIEATTKETLEHIAEAAHTLFSQHNQLKAELKQEMVQLAYVIASKLSPALMRQHPLAEIEALIEDCMVTAHREPRLLVRVAHAIAEPIRERLEDMKAATSFPGDIVLIGEDNMGPHDCRVEWPDGGTDRLQADIQREIENAVQRFVIPENPDRRKTKRDQETVEKETMPNNTAGTE